MSAKQLGSATISFGMVSTPVKLYPSTDSKAGVSFNQVNSKTGHRVKQILVDADATGPTYEAVSKEDIRKGYEYTKGQYVTFTEDEIKALEEKATSAIEIVQFVPLVTVERLYLEKAYFLSPDKGGDRSFALLVKALERSGRAAIGQYAARGKGYLVLLRPSNGRLVLEQMHYQEEMRSIEDVPVPNVQLKDTELKLAEQIIEQSATDAFDPTQFKNQVVERMLGAIQHKATTGQMITPESVAETQVVDLMDALKASVEAAQQKKVA